MRQHHQVPLELSHKPFVLSYTPFGLSHTPFELSHTPFELSHTPFELSHTPFGLSLSKPRAALTNETRDQPFDTGLRRAQSLLRANGDATL